MHKWATWREIAAQPGIWRDWGQAFDPLAVAGWIGAQGVDEIWLTGAGSSAYIGQIVAASLEGRAGARIRAIASTDIVSRPRAYLAAQTRPLVVSFGRSGDSAESLGVLDALNALAPDAPRLNITCNASGALATRPAPGPQQVIVLPKATHDAGFAMTSSLTTMLLTALAVLEATPDFAARMDTLARAFEALPAAADIAPPERAVFLGAGPLGFAAREAALKVMELSAGRIPALWDSTLGFRHGPKSFVTPGTAIFLFASADPHARLYDDDLAAELRAQFPDAPLSVSHHPVGGGDGWASVLHLAPAQKLAALWSQALGLNVDDPFAGQGTLTRVVSGVTLHAVTP